MNYIYPSTSTCENDIRKIFTESGRLAASHTQRHISKVDDTDTYGRVHKNNNCASVSLFNKHLLYT